MVDKQIKFNSRWEWRVGGGGVVGDKTIIGLGDLSHIEIYPLSPRHYFVSTE